MNKPLTSTQSLSSRLIRSAGVWCLFVLGVSGLGLSSVFSEALRSEFDARLAADLVHLAAAVERTEAGQLVHRPRLSDPRFERVYSGWYWQVSNGTDVVLRSRSLWDAELEIPAAGRSVDPSTDSVQGVALLGPNDQRLRLVSRQFRLPGSPHPFEFVVAGSSAPIDVAAARFNRTLWIALLVLGIGLVVAVVLQVRYGLGPLRAVSQALASIRAGSHSHLQGPFPHEIQPLATELNALLDQNTRVVERARTQVGNLAHGLKTPLSVLWNIAAESPPEQRKGIERQLSAMQVQVDRYLARARAAGPVGLRRGRTAVHQVVDDLARTLAKIYHDRGHDFELRGARTLAFAGDSQDLQEVLGNLLDNAFKWARSAIRVTIAQTDEQRLRIEVSDDGPGLAPERWAKVLERGKRLDESTPGSGLGLDIARELVELYGGTMGLMDADAGGLAVVLDLPAAEPISEPPLPPGESIETGENVPPSSPLPRGYARGSGTS